MSSSRIRAATTPRPSDWAAWLRLRFPEHTRAPFAQRHADLWGWAWSIVGGQAPSPPAFVGIWPRGGAKSTTAELVTVQVGERQTRRYVLYVSETQDQADRHVMAIGRLMEQAGMQRAVNKYGSSRGWRRNQLISSLGFKVEGIGLDSAARGAKLDEDRPDLIIIDDVDSRHDTGAAVQKKIETITQTILPAMAAHGAVLAVQNLIHANSIFSQLADGRADFLTDRIVSGPHRAVDELVTETVDGRTVITGGTPSWAGQDLAACQRFINTWGWTAFAREAQQDIARGGAAFPSWRDGVHLVDMPVVAQDWPVWAAFDYGHAHNTAFGVFTRAPGDVVYLLGEHVRNDWLPRQHAPEMDALCQRLGIAKARLRRVVAGHDVFARKGDASGQTIAEQYAALGWDFEYADIDRVNGWSAVRERLGDVEQGIAPRLFVVRTCLISAQQLRLAMRDPRRLEDVEKTNSDPDTGEGGDDALDMTRYGVMAAGGHELASAPSPLGGYRG